MKTLIIALNSKFIHSALAPWYLKASCGPDCGQVLVLERTVNENQDKVLSSIYLHKPDVAAFSCYIWNIRYVLDLASSLKKLLPATTIVLGGPEVSYCAAEMLRDYPFVDFVLAGEGEISFPGLLSLLAKRYDNRGTDEMSGSNDRSGGISCVPAGIDSIEGIVYRSGSGITEARPAVVKDLDSLKSPYTEEMISSLSNKIVYFEASRGCPFSCSYCLSSATAGTRFFSFERVCSELDKLVKSGVKQIKFVDRTFNANPERAKGIVRYILELNQQLTGGETAVCNFHFEVGADLFDDEFIGLLSGAPQGLIQLEAGVQSTNEEALAAVCRKTDVGKLLSNIEKIRRNGNIHVHADLIAGLPYEDFRSFGKSFSDVYSVKPHHLQLGFLKFLKGTKLRDEAEYYGYRFCDHAPYEILAGHDISAEELIRLKGIEELLERYYNSGRFMYSLDYMIRSFFNSPFEFFERFYVYNRDNGHLELPSSVRDLYLILYSFYQSITVLPGKSGAVVKDNDPPDDAVSGGPARNAESNGGTNSIFCELLRLDFLASDNSGTLPEFLQRPVTAEFRDKCFKFLKNAPLINKLIPETTGMLPKQILKKVHFQQFFFGDSSSLSMGRDSSALSTGRDGSSLSTGRDGSSLSMGRDSSALFTGRDGSSLSMGRDSSALSTGGDSSSLSTGGDSSPLCMGYDPSRLFGAKGPSQHDIDLRCKSTVLLFSYFSRDKVTGRYQFYKVDI